MDGELVEKFLKYVGTDRGPFICITQDEIGAILSICQNDDESLTQTEVDGDRVRVSGYEAGVRGLQFVVCVFV